MSVTAGVSATLNSGATLQFEYASPTNALALNGGTLYAANSAGVTWMGPVTVNSKPTCARSGTPSRAMAR